MTAMTAADVLAAAFARAGVQRIFGVPGGGSSLDLIAAARRVGIGFVLARHEFAAGVMASVTAELSGAPGVALCTRGPGVGNMANAMANAALERSPLVLVADGFAPAERAFATHQYFDHAAMLAPVVKVAFDVGASGAGAAVDGALAAVMTAPRGAALIELSAEAARGPATAEPLPPKPANPTPDLTAARALLASAKRPVAILGLEMLDPAAAEGARALVAALGCPALVTYKAKGAIADTDTHFAGVFTGGAAEGPVLDEADLILLLGADPVEFIPRPWRWSVPVLDCGTAPRPLAYRATEVGCYGALGTMLAALAEDAAPSAWNQGEIVPLRTAWRQALGNAGSGRGLGPQAVVEIAQAACRRAGADPRVAVDAGAHMFPVTTFWEAERPGDLLISNGLATMGFALPAAIAAAQHDPVRGAIACIGDGGLLMQLGELATAATLGARVVVLVFNDACLSLIDIKKGTRYLPDGALDWPRVDFAAAARALGVAGFRAESEAELEAAFAEALALPGPSLIDVTVDPSGYPAQIKALRG
ncbi:thiamine pyrophosphate-dependent enzyme [Plastoroseomonas arctica]|uniref:Thiamine pyrophosphate-binding protein n=1 Tax=Plastoroseomonas arctica TaxID=1509237 RepID=A0AAF1JU28_9PROT|nr:thiamine pyrophosphate-dependent enzyme [Plastoroseomonas arctica]MBR0653464.1 thiamine pyrophosphate-binding protein [Plastoroseomonas arctica]